MNLREALLSVYDGRRDVFAEQYARVTAGEDGRPVREATWTARHQELTDALVDAHLAGKRTLGMYLHRADGTVSYAVWDLDTRERATVLLMAQVLRELEIDVLRFDSGRKGYHLVTAFSEPVPSVVAYAFARAVWQRAGSPEHIDIFPAQEAITPDAPFGNQVKLPLGIHRATGRRCSLLTEDLTPVAEGTEIEELSGLRRLSLAEVRAIAGETATGVGHRQKGAIHLTARSAADFIHRPYPCFAALSSARYREGERDTLLFTYTKHLVGQGLPRHLVEQLVASQAEQCVSREGRPLPFVDWEKRVSQVFEHGYSSLGCSEAPMAQFCAGPSCSIYQRERGGSNDGSRKRQQAEASPADREAPAPGLLTLDGMVQIGMKSPTYEITVNGHRLELSGEQLASWARFRTAVMGPLRMIPTLPRADGKTVQVTWEGLVNDALAVASIEELPVNALDDAEVVQEALIYLRNPVNRVEERDQLLEGGVWEDADEEGTAWLYFLPRFLLSAIAWKTGTISNRKAWGILRPYSVGKAVMRLAKKPQHLWRMPAELVRDSPL